MDKPFCSFFTWIRDTNDPRIQDIKSVTCVYFTSTSLPLMMFTPRCTFCRRWPAADTPKSFRQHTQVWRRTLLRGLSKSPKRVDKPSCICRSHTRITGNAVASSQDPIYNWLPTPIGVTKGMESVWRCDETAMTRQGSAYVCVLPKKNLFIFAFTFTFRYKSHRYNRLSEVKVTILPSLTFTFAIRSKTSCFTSKGLGARGGHEPIDMKQNKLFYFPASRSCLK